jgi:hypothetical protein
MFPCVLNRWLPERVPTFPQTILADRMFKRMIQAYKLEVAQGVFKEIGNFEGDGNFLRLLEISRKILIGISEDDRYYREWLGLLVILASEEYQRWLSEVSPAEIKKWCQAQWYVSPSCLSDEFIARRKSEFAPDALAYYLHILSEP